MTRKTYYRVQDGSRDVTELLDPAEQLSRFWAAARFDDDAYTDRDRIGVSVCATREDLAAYLAGAGAGIPYGLPGWVLVELAGDISDDQPLDFEDGEYLVHPTEIINVAPIDDDFFDMIGTAYEAQNGAW